MASSVKSSKASTFGGHGEFPYLPSLETLQVPHAKPQKVGRAMDSRHISKAGPKLPSP
ncbi:hypothetical protein VM1G_11530 [Cytospora mali]|uniref:Uncharacterized protein n=1 Tax=Cytospora mali TaxID=578113 RepID=A0A194VWN0_CYTMA|nr:hypothetical protein VM1G_11530 [Valsa mali]